MTVTLLDPATSDASTSEPTPLAARAALVATAAAAVVGGLTVFAGIALLPAIVATALAGLLGVAAAWDARTGTIPNWLTSTAAAFTVAAVAATVATGGGSLVASLAWAVVAGGGALGAYLLTDGQAIGGGDVKLLPALAASLAAIATPLPMLVVMTTCLSIGVVGAVQRKKHVPLAVHLLVGLALGMAALSIVTSLYAPLAG